jgi:hypothetical protein
MPDEFAALLSESIEKMKYQIIQFEDQENSANMEIMAVQELLDEVCKKDFETLEELSRVKANASELDESS